MTWNSLPSHLVILFRPPLSLDDSGLLRVLESPGIIFPDFQGLESPWKQMRSLKVLESVSEGPWKCLNLIFWNADKRQENRIFLPTRSVLWPKTCRQSDSGPAGRAHDTPLRKVPVWVNLVLRIYSSYGPWKVLEFWFWQMGNHDDYLRLFLSRVRT